MRSLVVFDRLEPFLPIAVLVRDFIEDVDVVRLHLERPVPVVDRPVHFPVPEECVAEAVERVMVFGILIECRFIIVLREVEAFELDVAFADPLERKIVLRFDFEDVLVVFDCPFVLPDLDVTFREGSASARCFPDAVRSPFRVSKKRPAYSLPGSWCQNL